MAGSNARMVMVFMGFLWSDHARQRSKLVRPRQRSKTERCGRPRALDLSTDVARPHSLQ